MSTLERFSLTGKTALVTGAARGIGKALAVALAEAGADVVVIDIDEPGANSTASEIEGTGRRAMAAKVDVTDVNAVDRAIHSIIQKWGKLDIAVNNAGIATVTPAEDIPEDEWDRIMAVNLKAVFFCCRAEARVMLPSKTGSIINIASMSASIVNRPQTHAHYNASKSGVVQMSRTCAAEWAARGLRVNCLSPGHMVTPMTDRLFGEIGRQLNSNTPMGRIGTPDDLVGAVIFLASDASRYVTGLDLIVDGGYTLW
jgi:NAD(P)-dependent dehydrogenase (short-subunit alcohol dehydrogenase family)